MPLQSWMKMVSVDDHLIGHPKVWSDRLPAKFVEAGPRIVDEPAPSGGAPIQVWNYQGKRFPAIGLNAVAGKRPEEYGVEPVRYADMIPGCYDPKARLVDMDLDGVHAAANFPSFPRFAGALFTAEGCAMTRTDTIVAAATPPGRGSVGIVRISGPKTPAIAAVMRDA